MVISPLVLPLTYAKLLIAALVGIHLLPLLVLFITNGVPIAVRLLVTALIVCSASYHYVRWRHGRSAFLELAADGTACVRTNNHSERILCSNEYVDFGVFVILYWHFPERSAMSAGSAVLLKNSFSTENWRMLHLWLYHHCK